MSQVMSTVYLASPHPWRAAYEVAAAGAGQTCLRNIVRAACWDDHRRGALTRGPEHGDRIRAGQRRRLARR
jgi:hypothetical protein